MNKRVDVVIGANYGDEGKGKQVNLLATDRSLVIRFNGTCQSGHTVREGSLCHVFNHFGSGTFKCADTYFSKHFFINPMLFNEEYEQILRKTQAIRSCKFFAHPECQIITPYDMMLNQATENARAERHGSCGRGLFEAIQRSKVIPLTFGELQPGNRTFIPKLKQARQYALDAMVDRNIEDSDMFDTMMDDNIFHHFLEDCFGQPFIIPSTEMKEYPHYIFEGGQGLRLDKDNMDEFPHLTPSNTGLKNVSELLEELDLKFCPITVHYISRTYLTKHGNGGFRTDTLPSDWNIVDTTNTPNDFQGTMRFGLLDIDDMKKHIEKDMQHVKDAEFKLVLNCVDQTPVIEFHTKTCAMGDGIKMGGGKGIATIEKFVEYMKKHLNMEVVVNGPY